MYHLVVDVKEMRKKNCYESRKPGCRQNEKEIALRKELTRSERQRHIVRLPKVSFQDEIESGSMRIEVAGRVNSFDVDRYGRLRLGSKIFNPLDMDEPGCIITLKKINKSTYKLIVDFKHKKRGQLIQSLNPALLKGNFIV